MVEIVRGDARSSSAVVEEGNSRNQYLADPDESTPETVDTRARRPQGAIPQALRPSAKPKQARADILQALPVKLLVKEGGGRVRIVCAPRWCAPWRVKVRIGDSLGRNGRERRQVVKTVVGRARGIAQRRVHVCAASLAGWRHLRAPGNSEQRGLWEVH